MHVSEGDERPTNDWLPFVVAHADYGLSHAGKQAQEELPKGSKDM